MAPNPTTPFPLYLLPSIPFRRRQSSIHSTSTTTPSPTTSPSSSPPTPTSFLNSSPSANLRCTKCLAHLIPSSCIISKGFTGRHGRAYLVAPPSASALLHPPSTTSGSTPDAKRKPASDAPWAPGALPNTLLHAPTSRQLVTGLHTVSDISCRSCGSVLGWKYVSAEDEGQRYKVGKFILETRRVVRGGEWEYAHEDEGEGVEEMGGVRGDGEGDGEGEVEGEVEFDSQDEDECEDLFSGVWSKEVAGRRRRGRAFR